MKVFDHEEVEGNNLLSESCCQREQNWQNRWPEPLASTRILCRRWQISLPRAVQKHLMECTKMVLT
jgi:hypothetical protein